MRILCFCDKLFRSQYNYSAVFTVVNPLTASIVGITIAGESISAAITAGYFLILFALFLYNMRLCRR